MKKRLLWVGCITAALLCGAIFWFGSQGSRAQAEKDTVSRPPMAVTVLTIKSHEAVFTKDLSGRTSAFQVAEIRPQVTGIILKRLFTEGSLVEKGRQLYQIDPATYQAAYDSAAASLVQARADLKALEPKVERFAQLVKIGGVSRQQYDDAVAALAQTKAGVSMAQAHLAATKIDLDYTKVFSPISGRIGRSSVTEGALVTANQTMALARVQNLDQIYVDVNQSSNDIIELRRRMKDTSRNLEAALFIENDSTPYPEKGKILFSDVTVDQGTGMVQLRILFPNPDKDLLPGLFVRARVEQCRLDRAITVPQQAVIRSGDGTVSVWTVDAENTVQSSKIILDKVIGDKWLVTEGLVPGDRVIVTGTQKIKPRIKVAPVEMTSTNS